MALLKSKTQEGPSVASPSKKGRGKPSPVSGRRWIERFFGEHPLGILLSTPYVAFVLVVFLVPFGIGVWMSFHDFFFAAPGADIERPFVGLENFRAVLSDPSVQQAFKNLAVFAVINIPLTVIGALVLALGLNAVVHWKGFFRVSYYLPYVTASVATIAVWIFMFNSSGVVNQILGKLAPDPSWLANPLLVMPLIAVYVAWKSMGFYMMLYLAALQNVAKEQIESAQMDGANRWQTFKAVTLPAIAPVTSLIVLLTIIQSGQIFTEPFLLTGGGPNGASMTPSLLMYQKGIQQGNPDLAAAIGLILVVAVLVLSWLSRKITERN